jgi:hypothetical protein
MRGRRRRLEPIDEAGVVADYDAGASLAAIQQHYNIGLTRLYRILDHHQVPRRRPTAPRLGNRVRQRVLADYRAGVPIDEIARKQGISPASVGNIALKAGLARGRRYSGDELVEMIADQTADKERVLGLVDPPRGGAGDGSARRPRQRRPPPGDEQHST